MLAQIHDLKNHEKPSTDPNSSAANQLPNGLVKSC
jgi:hypothetical protein